MYESHYGLQEPAFSLTPDPRFFWLSETHQEGLSTLCYAITRRKGFMLLTGEVGTGKSTLLRAALERIPRDLLDVPEVAMVNHTAELTSLDLLKFVTAEFKVRGLLSSTPYGTRTNADYIIALKEFLTDRLRGGLNTVLIIDEAQNLSLKALEQVPDAGVQEVEVSAEILKDYVGKYELAPGFVLTITLEEGRLMTQATGQPKIEVFVFIGS